MMLWALLSACVIGSSMAAPPWGLKLENNATVSGISAGGFMAVQYAVAFSRTVRGAGVFAGGPYFCAQGLLITAMTNCMSTAVLLNVNTLVSKTQSLASSGSIDPLSNVATQKYYLYSGTNDYTVTSAVVKSVQTMMQQLGTPATNFATQYSLNAGHGVPTVSYGVSCTATQSPYLNNCNYDGAGAVFQQLYGALNAKGTQNAANWKSLYTYDYVPSGWTDFGMSIGDTTHVYVPSSCQGGAACRLHFVFHGCNQCEEIVGSVFYQNAGYAEWAETNSIVLVFPQAISNPLDSNPLCCFDWWSYSSSNYMTKSGPQMETWKNIANYLGAQN